MNLNLNEYVNGARLNTVLSIIDDKNYESLEDDLKTKIKVIPRGIVNIYLKTTPNENELKKTKRIEEAKYMIETTKSGLSLDINDVYHDLDDSYQKQVRCETLPANRYSTGHTWYYKK